MQVADDKELLEKNKDTLLRAIGNVVKRERLRTNTGINKFSYEYDIGNGLLSYLEKGVSDTKITTMWKLANAFGMKFSDFARMIEAELPPDFDFYK